MEEGEGGWKRRGRASCAKREKEREREEKGSVHMVNEQCSLRTRILSTAPLNKRKGEKRGDEATVCCNKRTLCAEAA